MERIEILDGLKGYAIILVIIGHLIVYTDPVNFPNNILFIFIYTFHMPLLLFISGYLTSLKAIKSRITFIYKKVKGLIVPYLVWNLIGLVIASNFILTRQILDDMVKSLTVYYNLWFLPVLFISFLILLVYIGLENILKRWHLESYAIVVFAMAYIALLYGFTLPVQGLYAIRWFTPFFIAGYFVGEYRNLIPRNKDFYFISVLIFIFLFPLWNFGVEQFADVGRLSLLINFTLAITGIVIAYVCMKALQKTVLNKYLVFCGIYSLEIYVVSNLLALLVINIFKYPIWFGTGIWAVISGSVMFLLISIIAVIILSYNKYTSIVLFGRWSYKNMDNSIQTRITKLENFLISAPTKLISSLKHK